MGYVYTYWCVREYGHGVQAKKKRTITRYKPLKIGGLYFHLGTGYPGAQRILELKSKEEVED